MNERMNEKYYSSFNVFSCVKANWGHYFELKSFKIVQPKFS